MILLRSIALASAALMLGSPVLAEHRKLVGDTLINIGVVPARALAANGAERDIHGTALDGSGQQHVVVSMADAATGLPVPAAEVVLRVQDPKGRVEQRQLVPAKQNGVPDYSGVFRFGWSGTYHLQVRVALPPAPERVAEFEWTHTIP